MIFLIIIFIIFVLEYCIKNHMDQVRTLREQRPLARGRIILKKYYNTGAAGNLLSSHPKATLCIHAAVLSATFTGLYCLWDRKDMQIAKLGLAFTAGGGLSNLYDRLTKGHVVDYLSFGFGPKRFRKLVFNVSDFFVFAGVILCVIEIFRKEGVSWHHK